MRGAGICAVLLLSLSWFVACSSDSESSESGEAGGSGGSGTTGAAGVAGAPTGSAGDSAGGSGATGASAGESSGGATGTGGAGAYSGTGGETLPDGSLPDVVFEYDAGDAGQPDACASETITAEPIPLDLIMLLDNSGSMNEPGWSSRQTSEGDCDVDDPIKNSKWCKSIHALHDFFAAPSSAGMGVGFRTFSGDAGDCGAYGSLHVALDVLSGEPGDPVLAQLDTALNDASASGYTPTERALRTIIEYTLARQTELEAEDSNRKVIGILITDGEPTRCNEDLGDLNQLIVDHYNNTGIPTFVIGMDGANFVGLEEIAAGAGAESHDDYCNSATGEPCYYYDVGEGDGSVLVAALEEIRNSVIGCQFAVPTAEAGLVDLDTIEVKFTPSAGEPEETLTRVMGGEGNCSGDGYYTDNDETPTTILLCPTTCARAEAEPTSSVSIELLCEGA